MKKLLPMVGLFVLLLGIATFGQSRPASVANPSALSPPAVKATAPSAVLAPVPPAPVVADSELLLIFQAHLRTSQLIEEKLKASGIPELQEELRVLRARYEAWHKAHNVPAGWVWNDVAKQFEKPSAAPGSPAPSRDGATGGGQPAAIRP